MAETNAISLNAQNKAEMSLIDMAYAILKQTNKPFHYRDLMQEVARLKGLTEEQVTEVIARLYTEINIDGRFVCIGGNVWGLKRWYPTDKTTTEKATGGKKFVRKDMDDDDDFFDEEEEVEDEDDAFDDYDRVADDDEEAVEGFEDEEVEGEEEEIEGEEVEEEDEVDSYDEDDDF
ncbi:DNA-directed RNA polymerase subunit delta [Tumebacillus sp. DT12]|uniref:Probable DNA-directed RNA polymerase subunit delta n=1 Tax=Tumebacillus lacus TaxID=2995335 RepID=A0ABT3XB67_9BACL|nr:DNA-directed RNA polymerase subunit delta [Tumebacillus lacus]MCX7571999.1 DNA-directed RNA polymerase subunit delta [Tumebacillus lacus]